MARKYPKFLWTNPTKSKSTGPFIIHAQEPRFIVKPEFDEHRNLYNTVLIDIWTEGYDEFDVMDIMKEIPSWFNHSGRYQSIHEDDQLICGITQLGFLKDIRSHYTVKEAQEVIRIVFPTKAKNIFKGNSSYGLKHLLESVSRIANNSRYGSYKYCDNDTLINAFELEGFKWTQDGPNRFFNLDSKQVKQAYRIFRY